MNYLNSRGYVVLKSQFTPKQIDAIKNDLTISPIENHVVINNKYKKIMVFKENEKKMYLPRFYGIQKFGLPCKIELAEGDTIHVPFTKELREYQKEIVNIYLSHVIERGGGGGGILEVPCGRGKTIMALNILSRLQKKTLIIVHKEFLLNQWVDRINEFIPNARVGRIQGKTFDIENKDIVIGMIQTIYDRPYPDNTFASFGLTILDEVHRAGSEEFSKTLLKIVTPYMLGISATVDRKDGLTELLYMFIGPKIYSEDRNEKDGVEVRACQYTHPHEDYTKELFDHRGNIQYSSMINIISDFVPRRQFLLQVLHDLIKENDEKQIMVLSHKRDLLTYLETEINRSSFATCGQYVGGMKQHALNESESKQIVLATYSMAAEALDIKTLNTLVMVSPKTDIVQSVGRILRTSGNGKIIVDIVDSHDVFKNQWKKRQTFYRKSEYTIKTVTSDDYRDMNETANWKVLYDPKKKTRHRKHDDTKCELTL